MRKRAQKKRRNQPSQLGLNFAAGSWGGARVGAGRPRGQRRYIAHRSRPALNRHQPLHITLRVRPDVPSLRNPHFIAAFRHTLAQCSVRNGFRVIHYAIQTNHAHCIMEAHGRRRLANGMKSFAARFARAVNRVFDRAGPVLVERFHLHVLKTPREVRNALAYVLLNARKHWLQNRNRNRGRTKVAGGRAAPRGIDPMSSGRWFDGWSARKQTLPRGQPEVAPATSWLLLKGWRRYRLIRPEEIPG